MSNPTLDRSIRALAETEARLFAKAYVQGYDDAIRALQSAKNAVKEQEIITRVMALFDTK